MAKLKEILAPKLKKIAKTQVFGKSACVHGPPDCEKKAWTNDQKATRPAKSHDDDDSLSFQLASLNERQRVLSPG